MPGNWVDLHEHSTGAAIFVNLDQATSFQRDEDGGFTIIWFLPGHPDGQILAIETPQEIARKGILPIPAVAFQG